MYSFIHSVVDMYSTLTVDKVTLTVDKVTIGYNVDFQLIAHQNKVKMYHVSYLLFTISPPWFKSAYPTKSLFCMLAPYTRQMLVVPFKYCIIHLTVSQLIFLGSLINQVTTVTARVKSSLIQNVTYMRLPTILKYGTLLM